MTISHLIEVNSGGIHGNCWFAKEDIPKGTPIWWADKYDDFAEWKFHIDTIKTWTKEEQDKFYALAYQIDSEWYSGFPPGAEIPKDAIEQNYVNHCCDGNCWYEGDRLLVAMKDIKKGEEVYYDYALTESSPDFELHCKCGKESCRGLVKGTDYQKKDLQEKYGNHFLPHILKKIEEEKGKQ